MLAGRTVAWATLIETGSKQEGASFFSLLPASDLPLFAEPNRESAWQRKNGNFRDPASAPQNTVWVGRLEAEEQFLYNQQS